MYSFPRPAVVSAFAGAVALPFSLPAAGLLLLAAALGVIIRLDYAPRRVWRPRSFAASCASRRRASLRCEPNQLAA